LLDDLGLVPALRAHAELSFESADISFEMDVRGMEERILAPIETALFRIFQEALTNVVRHANATRVVIRIERADHSINGSIQDDGIGFHPAEFGSGARDGRGFGLLGMQERAKILGGHIEISSKPGEGTLVKIQVPIPSTNVD
jgi:two-component system sensor histidine kinase DegS